MTTPGLSQTRPFTADCSRKANEVSLRVSGRLVVEPRQAGPDWSRCLERLAGAAVRVDLGSVTEIDARGLGMLAELTRETRRQGGDVAVVKASPRVRRLLELTHLDTLLADTPGRGPRIAA
jgi:anti-anti-sigma factor